MATWDEFIAGAGEIGELAQARIIAPGVVLVGTLRADGSPRISPVEPLLVDGELELGMMWRSRKALDLMRDPRCVVHSVVTDRMGTDGDLKLYGRARDVESAGYVVFGEGGQRTLTWRPV